MALDLNVLCRSLRTENSCFAFIFWISQRRISGERGIDVKKVLFNALGIGILTSLIGIIFTSFTGEQLDLTHIAILGFFVFYGNLLLGYLRYSQSKNPEVKKVLFDAVGIGIISSLIGIILKQFIWQEDWDLSYLVSLVVFFFTSSLLIGFFQYRKSKKQREESKTDTP
jgi:sugar phosphate permease